jgi:hypothetical protein
MHKRFAYFFRVMYNVSASLLQWYISFYLYHDLMSLLALTVQDVGSPVNSPTSDVVATIISSPLVSDWSQSPDSMPESAPSAGAVVPIYNELRWPMLFSYRRNLMIID